MFRASDWNTIAEMLTDDHYSDDRRRVIGDGIRQGRDTEIEDLRAVAEFGSKSMTTVCHCDPRRTPRPQAYPFSGRDSDPRRLQRYLHIVEIDAESGSRRSSCSRSTNDAAIKELDARYLAGEAAATRTRGRSSLKTPRHQPARTTP